MKRMIPFVMLCVFLLFGLATGPAFAADPPTAQGLVRTGKPTDNAFAEAFNGRGRAESLNAYLFLSLDDARIKFEAWRRDYNEHHRTAPSATEPWWRALYRQGRLPALTIKRAGFFTETGPKME